MRPECSIEQEFNPHLFLLLTRVCVIVPEEYMTFPRWAFMLPSTCEYIGTGRAADIGTQ